MLIDFNKYKINDNYYGGMAGSKLGIDYNNEKWFLKFPKSTSSMRGDDLASYTNSPVTEYIGSKIYKILGYEVQDVLLGYRDNKIVVACRDFCYEKNVKLIKYEEIRNMYMSNVEIDEEFDDSPRGKTNLNRILLHLDNNPAFLKIKESKSRFWECAIIDGLINNNDRNAGNWGIISYQDGRSELAPIYDNGASFYDKITVDKVINIRKNSNFEKSILNINTSYEYNKQSLTYEKLLNLDNKDKDEAIKKVVPIIKDNLDNIIEFIDSIPEEDNNIKILDKTISKLYIDSLIIRFNKLLLPKYNELIK